MTASFYTTRTREKKPPEVPSLKNTKIQPSPCFPPSRRFPEAVQDEENERVK
jgi:hypothetical protein